MSATVRSESFHLLGEQVAATLQQAHVALEAYAEGDAGPDGLRSCAELLHSARGALQVAEVYGASLLAEEMELACTHLADSKPSEQAIHEGIDSLSRSMVQLPAYVERIMGGGRDIPLVLLPLLNDLRAARGNPLLSESTLLLLNIEPPRLRESAPPLKAVGAEDIVPQLAKLRPQFQLGLLGWIKGGDSDKDLRRMAAVAERLEFAAPSEEVHQLWWVVGGVLEALIANGLEASVALKRLMGQADREIKRFQQKGAEDFTANPSTDLINNLLYYVARAPSGGERCDAIRAAFNLSGLVPGDEQVEELRADLSAPSARLMKTVADAIREDLGRVKDVLDIYVRTGMQDATELQAQLALLRKIGDTLGVLGLGALREIVQQRGQELSELIESEVSADESRLVVLAAALLDVEQRLDTELLNLVRTSDDEDEDPVDAELHHITEAVMRECIVNLTRIKETITQTLANTADIGMVDSLEEQFRGISAGLIMLGKTRAVDVLGRIGGAIRKCLERESVAREPDYVNRLADSIVSLEYYMETLQSGRKEPFYMLDNAERCLDVMEVAIPAVVPAADDTEEPLTHTATLQIDHAAMAESSPVVPEYEKTSIINTPVMATDVEQPDPELLELFIEEAREAIASINRHYPAWADNYGDAEALITIRRAFHTLKGSGRMVGAVLIGEYCWNIEDLLNRLINNTVETVPGLVVFIGNAIEALPQLLEQLEAGVDPVADLEAISNDATVFAAGNMPERYASMAVPVEEIDEPGLIEADEPETPAVDIVVEEEAVAGIDPVLLDILQRETATHLAAIREFLANCRPDGEPFLLSEEMHRACHTLHGSVTMADATEATVVSGPLYQLVEHLYGQNDGLSADHLVLCAAAADAVETIIAHLSDPAIDLPNTESLQAELTAAAASVETESAAEEAAALDAEVPATVDFELEPEDVIDVGFSESADQPVVDTPAQESTVEPEPAPSAEPEFDAEIAAIFLEEAAEILEASDLALTALAANRQDESQLAELQRHLHTLKGGARMAGIVAMGDFSHELESLLIRVSQGGTGLDDSVYGLLQASIDDLHRMREEVPRGSVSPPAAELLSRLAGIVEATRVMPALPSEETVEPPAETPAAEESEEVATEAEVPTETTADSDAVLVSDDAEVVPEETAADAESIADETVADDLSGTFSVPEPAGLGELARELTSDAPAPETPLQEVASLPEDLAPPLPTPELAPRKELARVDSAMLENLLNDAGEISIFHSRLNQQMSSIQFNLDELGQTVRRFQQQLRQLEMETEAQILFKHQSEASAADQDFDPLELDRYSKIQQLSRGLTETASDVSSIKDLLQNIASDTESILSQQARTTSEMQDSLMRTRMVPFDQHIPRLSRLIRQQAVESSKQVELKVEGSSGELDRQVMEKLLPPLEHMLRNAIVHGIEKPEVRTAAGKPAEATISIRFGREGSQVLIDVVDDGAGINIEAVRTKALEQGLITQDQELTDEEAMQLILESGLTTADKLTQSAGRGIGMDVVVSEIAKLGGTLSMESEPGKGCTFTVRLPYTLAITQAFIVKSGGETFALPLPTVEGVVRISRNEFEERMADDDPAVEYDGRRYRLRHLGPYLGLGPARLDPDDSQVSLILVEAGVNSTALISDVPADSREIVVKPIGQQLATIRGLAGATILGDGRIVVILDAGALVRSALSEAAQAKPVRIEEEDLPPLALVVDDSITMRRVTQRLLERNNMRVITAKDGMEAVEVLQDHIPDIIFLDVEMPRMDGYEFAGHVRNTPQTADLPIIMVTSRVGEKHRARAIELGVNDYLGKPYQEHELLDAMRNILGESLDSAQDNNESDVVS